MNVSNITKCPLCGANGSDLREVTSTHVDGYTIRCFHCGTFAITDECIRSCEEKLEEIGYILSGINLELNSINNQYLELKSDSLEKILKDYEYLVPNSDNLEEKVEKLLKFLRKETTYFTQKLSSKIERFIPIAYAQNSNELRGLFDWMKEKNLVEWGYTNQGKDIGTSLLHDGWELANKIKKGRGGFDKVFIAAWSDQSTTEIIDAIKEVVKKLGFQAIWIPGDFFSQQIVDKALGEIRQSRFVIVDQTGLRQSVFFEAGFAYGLDIDMIYIHKKQEEKFKYEFYTGHYQSHEYEDVEHLKIILESAINVRIPMKK
ncbi:MAG: hypothetical protein Q8Q94_02365 [bacterium]|nr:hypothetical protein [bacterium]MDZ4300017.1 hypothetical protein [Candidatus Sungbacteria bacterium]